MSFPHEAAATSQALSSLVAHTPGGVVLCRAMSQVSVSAEGTPASPPSQPRVLLQRGEGDSLTVIESGPTGRSVIPVQGVQRSRAAGSPLKCVFPPQTHTGSTTSAAWPGWTSTRWSPPPTMPLSKSGQSATEDPPPHGRIRDWSSSAAEHSLPLTLCTAPARPGAGPIPMTLVSAGCSYLYTSF